MIRRVLGILRSEAWALTGYALFVLPLGLGLSPCLIGIPIVVYALGQLVVVVLRGARKVHGEAPEPDPPVIAWAGVLVLLGVAIGLPLMLLAAWTGAALAGEPTLVAAMGVGGASIAGAALGPVALAPFASASGLRGVRGPLVRSIEVTTRIDARRLAAIGATCAALMSSALFAWAAMVSVTDSIPIVEVGCFFVATSGSLVLALACLADTHVALSARAARQPERHAPRRLRALGLIVALGPLAMILAALFAALTPTPMQPVDHWPARRALRTALRRSALRPQSVVIPGGGARVRLVRGGISIEADDGGGAGFVSAELQGDFDLGLPEILLEPAIFIERGEPYGGPAGSFAVIATNDYNWTVTFVDRDGVRLDDSIADRVLGRLGMVGGVALSLACLLFLALAFRIGRDLGTARTLDAPDLDAPGVGGRRALEGTLRLPEGARVLFVPNGSALAITGQAWLQARDLRVALPEGPIPALGALAGSPADGSPVVLLSRFRTPLTAGLREQAAAFPQDGVLVLGSRADARGALVQRAMRVATWIAIPAIACLVVATASLLFSL